MARPSLATRARLAWRVFQEGMPWEHRGRKAAPFQMRWPAWREGKPEWQIVDYQGYVEEGFNLNSLIYSAVMYKARAITAAPLRAYGGDPKGPELLPSSHPLSRLAQRPNPYQSQAEFMQLHNVYLNLAGNSYVYVGRDRPSDPFPREMRLLRPDRVFIVPKNGVIFAFVYVPEGYTPVAGQSLQELAQAGRLTPILPQDIIHIKLPNPSDPLDGYGYGLSPISPLARTADVDNSVTAFLKVFFQRGTNLGYMLKFDRELDETEIGRIRDRWRETYGGWDNWDEVGILDTGASLEKLELGFNELGFREMDQRSESRILGPFGVPPILIGSRVGLERSTMANYGESRRQCWEDTIIPELTLFESEVDYYLTGKDDATFVRFDCSEVPALRADVAKQVESAYRLWQMGVPANQAAKVVGLAMDPVEGGDTGYLPISVVPVGTEQALPAAGGTGGAAEGDQTAAGSASAQDETRKAVVRPFRRQGMVGARQGAALAPGGRERDRVGAAVSGGGY